MSRQFFRFALFVLLGVFLAGASLAQSLGQNTAPVGTPDLSLHVASHWGGPINAAVVEGNRAYIANGRMFRILDLSDERNPVEMGRLELGGQRVDPAAIADGVRDVEVLGNFAYVGASGQNFFNIVDISNPRLPNLASSFSRFGGDTAFIALDVELYGDYAYVNRERKGSNTIEVFDIRNPLNAASAGLISSHGNSMLIHDGRLYRSGTSSSQSPALAVLDIAANPTNPPQIGVLDIPNLWTVGLTASGDHLYLAVRSRARPEGPPVLGLARGEYGVVTVDIANNPAQPVVTDVQPGLAGTGDLEDVVRLATANGRLFVPDRQIGHRDPVSRGLRVFDIASNPAQPTPIGPYFKEHGDIIHALAATDDRLYVADSAEGFVILDTSIAHWPVRLGKYHSPELLGKLTLDGDLLYVSDNDGGFTVLDVSDAQAPRVVGTYLARRHHDRRLGNWGIDKAGDIVFLAAGHSGLITVDVADPARPRTVGMLRIPQIVASALPPSLLLGLTVRDGIAYLGFYLSTRSGGASMLVMADVSNPSVPTVLGGTAVKSWRTPDSIAVDGAFAAMSGGWGELVDVGKPAAPVYYEPPDTLFLSGGAALFDDLRLLTVWWSWPSADSQPPSHSNAQHDGLHIQDVSNPASPSILHWIRTNDSVPGCGTFPRGVVNLTASKETGRAYVRTLDSIFIFDIGDPTSPQCLHRLDGLSDGLNRKYGGSVGNARFSGLLANEPRLYSTSDTLGLSILEVQGLEPPLIAVEDETLSARLGAGQQQAMPLRIRNEGGSALCPRSNELARPTHVNAYLDIRSSGEQAFAGFEGKQP